MDHPLEITTVHPTKKVKYTHVKQRKTEGWLKKSANSSDRSTIIIISREL